MTITLAICTTAIAPGIRNAIRITVVLIMDIIKFGFRRIRRKTSWLTVTYHHTIIYGAFLWFPAVSYSFLVLFLEISTGDRKRRHIFVRLWG